MYSYLENEQTSPLQNHANFSIEVISLMASRSPLNLLESSRQELRNFLSRIGSAEAIPTKQNLKVNFITWWETDKVRVSELSTTRVTLSSLAQQLRHPTLPKQDQEVRIIFRWVIRASRAKKKSLYSWAVINGRSRLFSRSSWEDLKSCLIRTLLESFMMLSSISHSDVLISAYLIWQERPLDKVDSEATTLRVA